MTTKTALVTGASRGIGRATALALAHDGFHVLVHYGQSRTEAESLVAEITASGGKATPLGADLAAPDGARQLAAATRAVVGYRLDVLVANAGIAYNAPLEDHTVEKFDELFAVNVRAPLFLVQQLEPLLGDASSVILLSSAVARLAFPGLAAYSATKGAIDTLVKQFAALLGKKGVRVNAVAPGVIQTDMSSFAKSDEGRSFVLGFQALQRIGQPDDIADVVAFLAGNKSRWITGTTIAVDGGSKL